MKKITLQVNIDIPECIQDDVSPKDLRDYVKDAVGTWKGQFQPPGWIIGGEYSNEPGNPLFLLEDELMKVDVINVEH